MRLKHSIFHRMLAITHLGSGRLYYLDINLSISTHWLAKPHRCLLGRRLACGFACFFFKCATSIGDFACGRRATDVCVTKEKPNKADD